MRSIAACQEESSILIISHQERILNIADEVVVLKNGQITDRGGREKMLPKLVGTVSAVKECPKSSFGKAKAGQAELCDDAEMGIKADSE